MRNCNISLAVVENSSFAEVQADELSTLVYIQQRFYVVSADTEDEIFAVCFDNFCLEVVHTYFRQRLEMVYNSMSIVTCIPHHIFVSDFKILDAEVHFVTSEFYLFLSVHRSLSILFADLSDLPQIDLV